MFSREKTIKTIFFLLALSIVAVGGYFIREKIRNDLKDSGEEGISGETRTYTHPDYGFSLEYPANFTVGRFGEGEGEVVLFQTSKSPTLDREKSDFEQNSMQGFQIFVSLYEEKNPLSKAIIQDSAPDLKIQNWSEFNFDSTVKSPTLDREKSDFEKIQAFSFDTDSTREVWFVKDGNLYQFTSYLSFAKQMEKIIESLRFN